MRQLFVTLSVVMFTGALSFAASPATLVPATSSRDPAPAADANFNLSVYPEEISLDTARDYQNFIAVVRRDDDVTLDVTEAATWTLSDDKFAKLNGTKLTPLAEGVTELICKYGASEIRVPVKVSRPTEKLPISFEKDIVPILTRSGCNTGSCHGAKIGKDGFMISLFGYDPVGDYARITREIGMRRINLAVPQDSLFLTKATGEVTHTGGKLFDKESE